MQFSKAKGSKSLGIFLKFCTSPDNSHRIQPAKFEIILSFGMPLVSEGISVSVVLIERVESVEYENIFF